MENYESIRSTFLNGINQFKNNNYVNARSLLEKSLPFEEFRDKSLLAMAKMDIKEGKFALARQRLNDISNYKSTIVKFTYGLLEMIENNYERSKQYYNECIENPAFQYNTLLMLARVFMQNGDYEVSRMMLETLRTTVTFYQSATYYLICLNILEEKYNEALDMLRSINLSNTSLLMFKNFTILKLQIEYLLGNLVKESTLPHPNTEYIHSLLLSDSDEILLSHISRHLNQDERYTNGCFFSNLDLKKLLQESRDIIQNMHAQNSGKVDVYNIKMDNPIGYKEDYITNDLSVVASINTKKIITMYPILLSREFNIENNSLPNNSKKRYKGE